MIDLLKRAAAAALLLAATAQAHAADKLTIGTEGAYPPFNTVDAAGKISGFDVDIALALCEKMKVECTVVTQDWDGIIPGLLAKKYDMIVASMFITEERKQKVDFSDPYYKAAMTLVAKKGAGLTDFTAAGLKGKVIGVQSGTTQEKFASAMYPESEIKAYTTQDEVNLDMVNSRLDLQVGDMLPMIDWVSKADDGKCCELIGEPITDPKFVGDGVGIALRQEDDTLREAINKALAEIIADGTYKKINDTYFTIDVYTMK